MQFFVVVLTDHNMVKPILRKLKDNNYHGSVLSTRSIRQALMESDEPLPYFGGLSKVVEGEEEVIRPMITSVVKDEEVEVLASLVRDVVGKFDGNGFMYSLPINFIEGLK